MVKNPPVNAGRKRYHISYALGQEDSLEEGMATYSCILAWEIPWTEEPGGLQPIGSQRVRHDLVTKQNVKNRLLLGFLKRQL